MVAKEGVAYIFPGQGAQYVGMGKDLYDNFREAREVFDRANEIAGFDIEKLCFEGPKERLSTTTYSQPAILVASIAALRVLEARLTALPVRAALGLSLGEYAALVSARSVTFEDALKLVKFRGRFMDEASRENPGKMASIIGMERKAVEDLCGEAGCEIANLNCPGQVVISGKSDPVLKASALAKERGAKRSLILDVSGPFHSSLMKSASEKLESYLKGVDIKDPALSFVSNVNASYETEGNRIKENLLKQLTGRTYWEDSIRLIAGEGIREFYEIGPGKVLKGLLRRIDPDLTVHNVGNLDDLNSLTPGSGSRGLEVGG
jgi:[acyl-carrier-protein] S-malonyltransferase